jgi:multidrug efflux pump subunit AcrA (membrane-fusion protein)
VTDVQAREVMTGQPVTIDTHSALIAGRVVRVDPAVKEGKVAVDVELAGELPAGARPDLEVYGKIEIERLDDVLQLSPRPGLAETDSTISLFRAAPAGEYAERTTVRLGRGTLGAVEVREGLQTGDRVIVSDMRRYDDVDRVLLPAQ